MVDPTSSRQARRDAPERRQRHPVSNAELGSLVTIWHQRLAAPPPRPVVPRREITVADLDALHLTGDPLAERFLAAKGLAGLNETDDLDALDVLRDQGCQEALDLWSAVTYVPSFLDFDAMGAAATFAYRNPLAFTIMQFGAFPFTYTGANVAHVVDFSGRLGREGDQRRRFWETIQATVSAYDIEAMKPGGESWKRWIRVRLMHTRVRTGISRSGSWDCRNGTPISALSTTGGIYAFATYFLRAGPALGARPTPSESLATLRLWQWVAYLQGAPLELILEDIDEHDCSDRQIVRHLYGPTDVGRRLTADWIDCVSAGLSGHRVPKWFVRTAIGDSLSASMTGMPELAATVATDMGIPQNGLASFALRGVTVANAMLASHRIEILQRAIESIGRRAIARSVRKGLRGVDATHHTPLGQDPAPPR